MAAPILNNFAIEGDAARPSQRGDSHMLVYDEDTGIDYEFYQPRRRARTPTANGMRPVRSVWNMKTDSFRTIGWTSVDAAGLSVLAGLATPDEGLPTSLGGQGVITHALRFTLENDVILDQYIYPGSHRANSNTNATINPPMGARFRLKASVNISYMDPESKIVAKALKTYGLILADNGGNFFVSGAGLLRRCQQQRDHDLE